MNLMLTTVMKTTILSKGGIGRKRQMGKKVMRKTRMSAEQKILNSGRIIRGQDRGRRSEGRILDPVLEPREVLVARRKEREELKPRGRWLTGVMWRTGRSVMRSIATLRMRSTGRMSNSFFFRR